VCLPFTAFIARFLKRLLPDNSVAAQRIEAA
jgi:hypothetical protein